MAEALQTQPAPARLMNGEKLYSFSALAPHVPGYRANAHANASTLFRWATKGVKTARGGMVKLEAVRVGTAWKSSFEAIGRFCARLTEAATPADDTVRQALANETPKQRQRAAERASREAASIFGTAE
jgi:hypothetical protein